PTPHPAALPTPHPAAPPPQAQARRAGTRLTLAAAGAVVLVIALVATSLIRGRTAVDSVGATVPPGVEARPVTSIQFDGRLAAAVVGPGGSVYIAAGGKNQIVRMEPSGTVTTVAGTGAEGSSGDGGPATQAQLAAPTGIAIGTDGAVYIADTDNHRIRRIDPNGTITTIAGTGAYRFAGDGGPATQAPLAAPTGIAIGPDGALYIADTDNHRIRQIDPNGTITTLAGTGTEGFSGDNEPATQAQLDDPQGVAIGPDGAVSIADTDNHRIRRVDPNGIITTLAGTGTEGFAGDRGPATQAQLDSPEGIAIAGDGTLYIADTDNHRIRQIDPNGTITTLAGTGAKGFFGDGGPATQAQLAYPTSVAIGTDGALSIADDGNHRIRGIDAGGAITTLAGTGPGYPGDGGPARRAQLDLPTGVAIGPDGAVYVVDTDNDRVRRIDADGIITTVAGTGIEGFSGDGGPATQAQLDYPTSVAIDQAGNLYITDGRNERVRRVDADGIITTVVGTDRPAFSGDGPATQAQLAFPTDVAIDQIGNLYITEAGKHRVRRVDADGIMTTVAGTGIEGFSGDGGPATQAQLTHPEGIAVDDDGTLYITDDSNRIRRVDADGIITTVAGTGAEGFSGDGGPATQAELNNPEGIAIGGDGTLYIADSDNDRIRRITPTGVITTLAGTEGPLGGGDPATHARFAYPTGVAIDQAGNLYITESGDGRLRGIDPTGVITTIAGGSG
ncbi:MAG: hypothetical protein ACRD0K_13975, partial [Egibacteraceae bacterium]